MCIAVVFPLCRELISLFLSIVGILLHHPFFAVDAKQPSLVPLLSFPLRREFWRLGSVGRGKRGEGKEGLGPGATPWQRGDKTSLQNPQASKQSVFFFRKVQRTMEMMAMMANRSRAIREGGYVYLKLCMYTATRTVSCKDRVRNHDYT